MTKRLPLFAFLLLTYSLLLGHDLLPHHHHDGHSHHHHATGHSHDHPTPDDNSDRDSDWFCHQHALGSFAYEPSAPTELRASVAVILLTGFRERRQVAVVSKDVIGWPATRPNAPPGYEPYRPLRAPPVFHLSLG